MKGADVRNALASWRYAGNRFADPICGHRFRRLAPGPTGAPDAVCPRCWSAERHRLLWLFLERETPLLREPLGVLHLAPERGLAQRLRRAANLDYVSADIEPGRAMVAADLSALPFPDGRFDVVLASHVLEHVDDDRAALREIRRVLAGGGFAVLQHPIDRGRAVTHEDPRVATPAGREREFLQADHVRVYGVDIEDRFREAGFQVQRISYIERVSERERERYRLEQVPSSRPERDLEADMIYVCRVPV